MPYKQVDFLLGNKQEVYLLLKLWVKVNSLIKVGVLSMVTEEIAFDKNTKCWQCLFKSLQLTSWLFKTLLMLTLLLVEKQFRSVAVTLQPSIATSQDYQSHGKHLMSCTGHNPKHCQKYVVQKCNPKHV